jgi:hypothetical protein
MKKSIVTGAAILFSMAALAGEQGAMGKASFDKIDSDRDGYVDQVEASAAGITEGQFSAMDKNRDGKVSKEEYQAATQSKSSDSSRDGGAGGY